MSVYYKYLFELEEKPVPLFTYNDVRVLYMPIHVSDRYELRSKDNNFAPEKLRPYIKKAIDRFNTISNEKLKLFSDIGILPITIISKTYPYKIAGTLYQRNDNNVSLVIRTILNDKQKSKDDNELGWVLYTESMEKTLILYID